MVIFVSPNPPAHSLKLRFVVNHAGALIEFAEQVEEQCAAGCAERQVTKLVEDHQIATNQPLGNLSGFSLRLFLLERIDEFDGGIKASLLPMMLESLNR